MHSGATIASAISEISLEQVWPMFTKLKGEVMDVAVFKVCRK